MALPSDKPTIENCTIGDTVINYDTVTSGRLKLEAVEAPQKWMEQSTISDVVYGPNTQGVHSHTIAHQSPSITVRDDTQLVFDGMDPMTGAELKRLLKALGRIIEKDYPEELL